MKSEPKIVDVAGVEPAPSAQAQRRDREVARTGGRKMPAAAFTTKVVGVSFVPGYPNNITKLAEIANPPTVDGPYFSQGDQAQLELDRDFAAQCRERDDFERMTVVLVRNPKNQYDSNAIEVHVPALGEHGMIGHVERPLAARMAPEMDGGARFLAEVVSVLINPDHPDRPGISINIKKED